jgi:hypothetical protein
MQRILVLFILLSSCAPATFQEEDRQEILRILDQQAASWNEGNIDAFMDSYLKTDSLMFIGRGGLYYGHQKTLDNYKRVYSTPEKMGKLSFDIREMKELGAVNALVIGSWRLDRSQDTLQGWFSLTWEKIDGEWVIIADHSS